MELVDEVAAYCKKIKNLEELTKEQLREKLKFLVKAPMTFRGYLFAYGVSMH